MDVNALPMISNEDIEANGLDWSMANDIKLKTSVPVIVNTDTSDGNGVHWISMVKLKSKNGKEIFIYDPLGAKNMRGSSDGRLTDKILYDSIQRNGPFEPSNIHIYGPRTQKIGNTLCGWYSMFVASQIKKQLKEIPDTTASELATMIKNLFDQGATARNIRIMHDGFKATRISDAKP